MSRVIIGRHHVSDVVSGCLLVPPVFARLSPLLLPISLRLAEIAASVNQRHRILANVQDSIAEYI